MKESASVWTAPPRPTKCLAQNYRRFAIAFEFESSADTVQLTTSSGVSLFVNLRLGRSFEALKEINRRAGPAVPLVLLVAAVMLAHLVAMAQVDSLGEPGGTTTQSRGASALRGVCEHSPTRNAPLYRCLRRRTGLDAVSTATALVSLADARFIGAPARGLHLDLFSN
jgi:hypothetical protein